MEAGSPWKKRGEWDWQGGRPSRGCLMTFGTTKRGASERRSLGSLQEESLVGGLWGELSVRTEALAWGESWKESE